ncbi:MAG: glycoside hydrolase [Candidatus Hydrogenedentes bacterium]|nr:glycoside hydrolase [Candidatus Hydrogenedentota bacterium]
MRAFERWLIRSAFACALLTLHAFAQGPGFHVDVFPDSETYPRNSEGSIIELTDGRLYLVGTRFYGGLADEAAANIVSRISSDGGSTWSEPVVIQENVGTQNVMSASLQRLTAERTPDGKRGAGPIGLFYLVTNSEVDLKVYLRTSTDEAKTWSEPLCVTNRPGYHVMNNDRVVRLSTGRLLCPVAWTSDSGKVNHYTSLCFISDDQGRTWTAGTGSVDAPKRGAMEPEVIERKDGSVLMLIRTQTGRNYAAVSQDGGDSWGGAEPFGPAAPEAPSTLRRIPSTGDWLLIFNPVTDANADHGGQRTPLSSAISKDEGKTWSTTRDIETRADQAFAYTSLIFANDRALMSYYVHDTNAKRIATRFRSIPVSWFYEEEPNP